MTTWTFAGRSCWRSTSPSTSGQAVDGAGTLSPVHIPSLGSYPADYIAPMQEWLKEFTLDLGNGETFQPYDPDAPQRLVASTRRTAATSFSDDPADAGSGLRSRLVQVRSRCRHETAREERLQEGRGWQVAAAGWHALEDRMSISRSDTVPPGVQERRPRPCSSGRSSGSTRCRSLRTTSSTLDPER